MRSKTLVLTAMMILGACGKAKNDKQEAAGAPEPTAGTPTAGAKPVAPPTAPAPKATASAMVTYDDVKVGPLAFDHQVVVDDGSGNHMVLLIAGCPQITESCSIPKYLREDHELLDAKCPGWSEVAISFHPKDQKGNMGVFVVPPGKYTSADGQPFQAAMVEYSQTAFESSRQIYNAKEPLVDVTRSDDKGMAGTITARSESEPSRTITGTFDARYCACDQNTGVCK